jgi:hypothetical protein
MKQLHLYRRLSFTLAAIAAMAGGLSNTAHAQLYTASNEIYEFDATTGTQINATLPSDGTYAESTLLVGNDLYVSGVVEVGGVQQMTLGVYDATTLAPITTTLASFQASEGNFNSEGVSTGDSPASSTALAIEGTNIYMANAAYNGSTVAVYNTLTGTLNSSFVVTDDIMGGMEVANGVLYVANSYGGTISTYDADTGALLNSNFIDLAGGDPVPFFMTISGNTLYIADQTANSVGTYDATTGAIINTNFVTNVNNYDPNYPGDQQFPGDPANTDRPEGLTVYGDTLYVGALNSNVIDAYSASTGAFEGVSDPNTYGVDQISVGTGGAFFNAPPGTSAAPEPRSFSMACIVLLSVGFLLRRRLISET